MSSSTIPKKAFWVAPVSVTEAGNLTSPAPAVPPAFRRSGISGCPSSGSALSWNRIHNRSRSPSLPTWVVALPLLSSSTVESDSSSSTVTATDGICSDGA